MTDTTTIPAPAAPAGEPAGTALFSTTEGFTVWDRAPGNLSRWRPDRFRLYTPSGVLIAGYQHPETAERIASMLVTEFRQVDASAQLRRLIANGLTIGEAMQLFGEHQEAHRPEVAGFAQAVRDAAPAAMRGSHDGFDVDAVPIVSESDDGAYVSVWVWVENEDAGIESADADGDEDADCESEACWTGHPAKKADLNAEGLCPTCAEQTSK